MEIGNEIKGFNIAEALKYAPKGLKLYSPIFGEVKFEKIDEDNCVVVRDKYNNLRWFYEYGTYFPSDENNFSEGECLLFPSTNHRCWQHWQNTLFLESIGSVCVDTIMGNKFILDQNGTFFSDGTGSQYSTLIDCEDSSNYLLNSRYATPEEAKEFFEELEKNGYKWDGKMVVKSTSQPKFKVGDIIKHKDTGIINTIKKVCSEYYILDSDNTLYFEAQDMWELAASKVKPTLEEKVNILADEIIALKERVKSLEIQEIKQCSDKNRLDSIDWMRWKEGFSQYQKYANALTKRGIT